jgi:RNA polymerase sigma-70 factor, ECF subfamily
MKDMDVPHLVSLAKTGDVAAFGQLVAAHQKKVHFFIVGMVSSNDIADELTQATFVKAWKGIAQFRGESAFESWLLQIAVNSVRSWQRWSFLRRSREVSLGAPSSTLEDDASLSDRLPDRRPDAAPEHALETEHTANVLRKAIERLPPREKEVFLLRHHGDMPLKDIAAALGIAEGSVKASLFHALEKLRAAFEEETT